MRHFVANAIIYNKALHEMYQENGKRAQQRASPLHQQPKTKRDPSSPFNTVHVNVETIEICTANPTIKITETSPRSTTTEEQPTVNTRKHTSTNNDTSRTIASIF
jgi:hypothetical protein